MCLRSSKKNAEDKQKIAFKDLENSQEDERELGGKG